MITLTIEDGLMNSAAIEKYCSHKRGKNWMSVNSGKNAANVNKRFLKSCEAEYDVTSVEVGDSITIAGDYTSGSGVFRPDRLEAVVLSITETEIVIEEFSSLAKSMKARPQEKKR